MTNCKRSIVARVLAGWKLAISLCMLVALVGCGESSESSQAIFELEVTIDQQPVDSVRVALTPKVNTGGAIVLEGITDHTGSAAMLLKDGVELASAPTEYTVVCESLGDWQIVKPWSDASKTPLSVTWPSSEPLRVELPAKAARAL